MSGLCILDDIEEMMGDMFNQVFLPSLRWRTGERVAWALAVEVHEKGGKLYVRAELPGMNRKDVKVPVSENILPCLSERLRSGIR